MFCKYCGNEIKDNSVFCPKCGKQNSNRESKKRMLGLGSKKRKTLAFIILIIIAIPLFFCVRFTVRKITLNLFEDGEKYWAFIHKRAEYKDAVDRIENLSPVSAEWITANDSRLYAAIDCIEAQIDYYKGRIAIIDKDKKSIRDKENIDKNFEYLNALIKMVSENGDASEDAISYSSSRLGILEKQWREIQ